LRPECHPARPALSGILDSETAATFLTLPQSARSPKRKAADEVVIRRWEIRVIAD